MGGVKDVINITLMIKDKRLMITHVPVLLHETIELLDIRPGDTVLDCTLGAGGHSSAIANMLGHQGTLIGLDADSEAIARARKKIGTTKCATHFIQENFRNLDCALDRLGIVSADKILFDIGFSSDQLELSGRGFSFQKDEPLLMTLKDNPMDDDLTAEEIVNKWEEKHIADVLYGFGGERFSRKIAHGITEARKQKRITTTSELVAIIEKSVPAAYRRGRIHPATKTFQALRIAVNDELGALSEALEKGTKRLKIEGRIAVISFHSLEDRTVKEFFKKKMAEGVLTILTKKPLVPAREEQRENPRSRSAKLRGAQKLQQI